MLLLCALARREQLVLTLFCGATPSGTPELVTAPLSTGPGAPADTAPPSAGWESRGQKLVPPRMKSKPRTGTPQGRVLKASSEGPEYRVAGEEGPPSGIPRDRRPHCF